MYLMQKDFSRGNEHLEAMNTAFPDAEVHSFEELIEFLELQMKTIDMFLLRE